GPVAPDGVAPVDGGRGRWVGCRSVLGMVLLLRWGLVAAKPLRAWWRGARNAPAFGVLARYRGDSWGGWCASSRTWWPLWAARSRHARRWPVSSRAGSSAWCASGTGGLATSRRHLSYGSSAPTWAPTCGS